MSVPGLPASEKKNFLKEFGAVTSDHKERIIWIGCNPDDPIMYEQQCKLMWEELKNYNRELVKLGVKYGILPPCELDSKNKT